MSRRGGRALVRFLGAGTPIGLRALHQSCILVETRGHRLLLDCGMTALTSLGKIGIDPAEIDGVVISHLHGEHFGGLPLLLLDTTLRPRSRPLTIAGPAATRQRVEQALAIFGWASAPIDAAIFVPLEPGVAVPIAGCEVTAFEVVHNPATAPTGLRVATVGATIAYSGDAGWSDALVEIARGADLFICGVWSFDTWDPTFVDLATLLAHQEQLDCRRMIVTHLGPSMLEHIDQVPLEVASDGLTTEL
ncbi:MAG: MBL fold metallo-hydrolase [Chloroflexi bacterium]|nr:MBL fold metallo-hydrolase [Chloroflexota bacterium]MBV9598405.1 MBL fold metallo-hydrolase [Chloroflexota bacterium]